jgi:hypothetical protein
MTHSNTPNEPCCPKFDTAPWDNKTFIWKDRLFIKNSLPVFFHIPLPSMIKRLMTKMWTQAQEAGAAPELNDFLMLITDPSPWRSEFYLAVNKEIPSAENIKMNGTFFTKVFDGPYNAVPKWIKEMDKIMFEKGKKVKNYYFHYTTCPKCAKIYGHNYSVAFAEIE